ncbi:MAG: dTDP-4-dehydrorhamnose 3,5-epimerase [Bacteroidales bacterium]|nr:dTDP-4-dehydrorhamnose 3,5-epimerase [Bacteroidales bacterium]
MNIIATNLDGLKVIEPRIFKDQRGYFFESYNENRYQEAGISCRFVQDNQSKSSFGVIRGLHYQLEPHAQTKLIRVLQGKIFDVVVDIRKGSPTFGKYYGIELSDDNQLQLFIPKGFAHGFSVLSPTAVILYKCDAFYNPGSERGINYNDKSLGIDWKVETDKAIVSDKDKILPGLGEAESNFSC